MNNRILGKLFAASILVLFSIHSFAQEDACTSIMVGRKASTDGSVITSHTCDGKYRTWATIEPAADYGKKAQHAVRTGTMKTSSKDDTTGVAIKGYIPEVRHTYSYLNTAYPALNEKQLGIGETTFGGPDTLRSDNGLFLIEELERIALQRCTKAREAVLLMGALAEQYGYIDGGECLTVADPQEVWQFEIIGPGKGKCGAVWVAKRVPDDHVAVSANVPRIGRLERKNKAEFLCSSNVESTALQYGLWDGKEEFKFWKVYNCEYGHGGNHREREWYILSTLAPSLGLRLDTPELPFSVKPDESVDVRKVMELLRATYEGTDLDMCRNIKYKGKVSPVANPWITTTERMTLNEVAPGSVPFARTVSVAWCAYSTVIQLRSWLPDSVGGICWLALDNPGQSPRIPVFSGNSTMPAAYERCGQYQYDPEIALWQFRKANKLATIQWQATKEGFMKNVLMMEDAAFENLPGADCTQAELDAYTEKVHNDCVSKWAEMEASYWLKFGLGF